MARAEDDGHVLVVLATEVDICRHEGTALVEFDNMPTLRPPKAMPLAMYLVMANIVMAYMVMASWGVRQHANA